MVRIAIPAPRQPSRIPSQQKLVACPFVVQVDDRERGGGWKFSGLYDHTSKGGNLLLVQVVEKRLMTADYGAQTAFGDVVPVLVERKSADDLVNSLAGGHQRFRAEHERMKSLVDNGWHCCVVIEASLPDVLSELDCPLNTRKVSSSLILGATASWPAKFGVPWHYAGDRSTAEQLCLRILWKAWERMTKSISITHENATH